VRFPGGWLGPRDWIGPREELVPLGKAAPAGERPPDDASTTDQAGPVNEVAPVDHGAPVDETATLAAGFWDGSVIQDAMPAPAGPAYTADGGPGDARPHRFARPAMTPHRRLSLIAIVALAAGALTLLVGSAPTRGPRAVLKTTAANLVPPALPVAHQSNGARSDQSRQRRVRSTHPKPSPRRQNAAPEQQAAPVSVAQPAAVEQQVSTNPEAAPTQPTASDTSASDTSASDTPASDTPSAASDSTASSGGSGQTSSSPPPASPSHSAAPTGPTGSGAVLGPGHCSC
jgi:hypothetical protein